MPLKKQSIAGTSILKIRGVKEEVAVGCVEFGDGGFEGGEGGYFDFGEESDGLVVRCGLWGGL